MRLFILTILPVFLVSLVRLVFLGFFTNREKDSETENDPLFGAELLIVHPQPKDLIQSYYPIWREKSQVFLINFLREGQCNKKVIFSLYVLGWLIYLHHPEEDGVGRNLVNNIGENDIPALIMIPLFCNFFGILFLWAFSMFMYAILTWFPVFSFETRKTSLTQGNTPLQTRHRQLVCALSNTQRVKHILDTWVNQVWAIISVFGSFFIAEMVASFLFAPFGTGPMESVWGMLFVYLLWNTLVYFLIISVWVSLVDKKLKLFLNKRIIVLKEQISLIEDESTQG